MSIKTIAKRARGYIITTKNGAKTTTGSFYTRTLKTYTPLENGFNKELADDVLNIISENEALWNQGEWRKVFDLKAGDDYLDNQWMSPQQVQAQVSSMIAFDADKTAPTCGTAMCFAGWVAELTGADFVIDADAIKAYTKGKLQKRVVDYYANNLLIARPDPADPVINSNYHLTTDWQSNNNVPDDLAKMLVKRGFTPATHYIGDIGDYASVALGRIQGSPLFQESNSIENIEKIVNTHVEHGPRYYYDNSPLEYEDDESDDDE
mgnify:FL=1